MSFDQEEMDEYCKQFTYFMQVELHKKYDLRSRKISRTQDDEEKEPKLVPSPMVTPQPKNSVKQWDKGKQPINSVKENEKQQDEASQSKSNDSNILEKIVTVPEKHTNPNRNQ